MLVDINLLPKKESKHQSTIVMMLVAALLLLVAIIVLFWHGKGLDRQIAALQSEITTTQKLVEIEQEKAEGKSGANSVAILESAVEWASEEPLKTVPIIGEVASLLPQRGFLQSISYDESGMVNLSVQFDTSRESAYYLKNLLDSEWFSEITLSSLSTSSLSDMDDQSEVIPRYTGQYQLKLNRGYIQDQEQIQASLARNEEGGAS